MTFVVVIFTREVSRAAHQESAARQSENLNFSAVATTLLGQENSFDARLAALLSSGATLTRTDFAVQMSQFAQELTSWRDVASTIRSPVLSPSLNVTLANATLTRVNDYETVLAYVARALALDVPAHSSLSLGVAQLSLSQTAATWGMQRHSLASAPGHVTLMSLTNQTGRLNVPQDVATLASAPTLAATRAIVIAAIRVQPAPFPAPALTLLIAPTSSFQVQVAVSNLREIVQPVSVTMTLTPAQGSVQRVTMTQTLAPATSFAFPGHNFSVVPGESATLTVSLDGVPASSALAHSRTYAVRISPTATG
ncbi:MAG: hypothetical protein KGL23_01350 [Acidobacteriota bacterium]|nr:hypothetical protein [Acidobacteriota bacterium]MDE3093680.1 hypothetical protein [Acidobacteriota bacterium]MDE3146063.1 hypothetical protein [Acidobacteriota bacterium]